MRPLIVCLAVAVSACGAGSASTTTTATTTIESPATTIDPEDLVLYESPTYGFAIAYPASWRVDEVAVENLIGFTAPATAEGLTPNFNVTVNEVSDQLPPAAYYEGEIERVRTSLENAEILEVVDVNVDGTIGRGLTLVTEQQGLDIGISRIIVINQGRAYEVSFFAEATDLQRLAPLVASIFQSLRWIG